MSSSTPRPLAPRPLLLGHRGARRHASENTLAAFDLALQHGCDGSEFDVRLTCDTRAVIFHDLRFHGRSIRKSTYEALCIHRGRMRRRRAPLPPAEALPCVEDVLDRFGATSYLDIELKVPGLEEGVLRALRLQQTPATNFIVSSFKVEVLRELRARDAEVPLGFVTRQRKGFAAWERLDAQLGLQVLVANHKLVSRELIDDVHAAGKQIFVWTVNRERQMLRLAEMGVDALISDNTELLGRVFRAHNHRR
jgi:glycerophosphoryl diester phosphodiesterase